jgi:PAS domain S-box-containing protein
MIPPSVDCRCALDHYPSRPVQKEVCAVFNPYVLLEPLKSSALQNGNENLADMSCPLHKVINGDEFLQDLLPQIRVLLDQLPEALVILDVDSGRFVAGNESALHLFNLKAVQPGNHSSAEVAREKIQRALNGERPVFQWVHRNAIDQLILCEVQLTRLPSRKRRLVCGRIIDLTQRQRIDRQLHHHNRELEALNAIALAVGSTLRIDEVLNAILEHLAALVPYDSSSIALWRDNEFRIVAQRGLPPQADLEAANRALNEGQRKQRVLHSAIPLIFPDVREEENWIAAPGMEYIRSWMCVPLVSKGRVLGVLNVDKTEVDFYTFDHAKQAMAVARQVATAIENAHLYSELERRVNERTSEVRSQMNQTEAILQNVAEAIMFADQDRQILYVNPAWERLTGYAAHQASGQRAFFPESSSTPHDTFETVWQTVLTGKTWRGVLQGKRIDDTPYEAEATITPIRAEDGQIYRYVSVERDVTEARQLEAMKARFLADIAHDLRSPVGSLKMRVYLIRKLPERFKEHLAAMEHVIDHLNAMVDDLLTLSRLELGMAPMDMQMLDLNEVVERVAETYEPLAQEKGLSLTYAAGSGLLPILADSQQMERMIVNLVSNAMNYTPRGGTVHLSATRNGNDAILAVRDTGIGISPEALPHIFDRFYRTNEAKRTSKGLGLGLAIAREIAEKHRGRIEAHSVPGEGSIFAVYLRVAE